MDFPGIRRISTFSFRASEDNARRILAVLSQFGFGSLGIQAEDLLIPGRVIQLGVKPNRIDILNSISGVSFEQSWKTRTEGNLDGVTTRFIGQTLT